MAVNVTPDGVRYLALARGERVPRPFHYRWLVPKLCGEVGWRWILAQRSAMVLCWVSVSALAGWGWRGWFCAALMLGLSGVTKFNLKHPVLVDLPSMSLVLCAAALCGMSNRLAVPAAVFLACVAGSAKETAPTFASAWAWNPWLLLGLIPALVRHLIRPGIDPISHGPAHDALTHPLRSAWQAHKALPLAVWVLPWGVLLVGLHSISLQLAVVLALAYAQCLIATDTVRLYQWAWPVLAIATARTVPTTWMLPALLVHWSNPFAGNGL